MGRNGGKGGCLTGERAGDAAFDQEVEVVSLEAPDLLPLDYLKKKQLYILFKSLFQKKKWYVEVFKQVQSSCYKIIKSWRCTVWLTIVTNVCVSLSIMSDSL